MNQTPMDALSAFEAVRSALQIVGVDLMAESRGASLWSMPGESMPTARAGATRQDPTRARASLAAAVIPQEEVPDARSILDALVFASPYDDARCRFSRETNPTCVVLQGRSADDGLEHTELVVGWLHACAYHRIYADVPAREAGLASSVDVVRLVLETAGFAWPSAWEEKARATHERR
jgi:hypothetical protein